MVFGVCRRTLGHQQDAEDAFQAVFLVLARKAHAVRSNGLSRWLYGVAVRVANKARVRRIRRSTGELPDVAAPPEPPPADWLPLLDAELARLADRDRGLILLCDLLGRSRAEAAAELGIAEGTLSSRLARARGKLRARLARLGASLSLTTLAAGLADQAAGTVPNSLIESTVAAGTSAAAARKLADGVLRTMFLAKFFKLSALGVCVVGMAAGAVAWLPGAGADSTTESQESPKEPQPAKDSPKTDPDFERIQGVWIAESALYAPSAPDGPQEMLARGESPRIRKGAEMRFTGNRVESLGFPGADQTFKLDSTHDPKWIDFNFHSVSRLEPGGRTGGAIRTRPAIYQYDGDKLQLALGDDQSQERPRSFDRPGAGSPFVSLVLRRPTADERARIEEFERASLWGKWQAVVETIRGEQRAAPPGMQLEVTGDLLRMDTPAGRLNATYVLTLATRLWQIDLTATADWGDVKNGGKLAGIVSRQGARLNLALGSPSRPTSFEAASRDGTVYTFVREGFTDFDLAAPSPTKEAERPGKSDQTRLRQLQRERVKALDNQLQGQFERVKIGKDPLTTLLDAARERAELELELAETKEAKLVALESWLRDLRYVETQIKELHRAGLQTFQGVAQATAARLKAEIQLEKLKAGK
jgi:RNA polymerase sigma factor (sigma-70 family)